MTAIADTQPVAGAGAPAPTPRTGRLRRALEDGSDSLLAFDPGLVQLLRALNVAVGLALCILSGYLFEQITHALWVKAPAGVTLSVKQAAELHAQHHEITVLAMLLTAPMGMLAGLAIPNERPKPLAAMMVVLPVPVLGVFAASRGLVGHRPWAFALLAVLMGLSAYATKYVRRFGPIAAILGQMLPVGWLMGYLNSAVTVGDIGWVAAWLYTGLVVSYLVKALVFVPLSRHTMQRTVRSVFARARSVLAAGEQAMSATGERDRARARRRLRRRMTRLTDASLTADGLLGAHPELAAEVNRALFETELTAQRLGRIVLELSEAELPDAVRATIRSCLTSAGDTRGAPTLDGLEGLRAHAAQPDLAQTDTGRRLARLGDLLLQWRADVRRWAEIEPAAGGTEPYSSPVMLLGGLLPGPALVGASAASAPGTLGSRLKLSPPAQSAIRLSAAITGAAVLGSVVDSDRFYWAVLAVFIAFGGTATRGDQLGKAVERVIGTVLGIFVGGLLAHLVGTTTWSVAIIVTAFAGGTYLMSASYPLMVVGVTIAVSQLYQQLGEYSNHLLVLRLEETAVGAGVAALAALLIFPVNNRRAAVLAARRYFGRLGQLLDGLTLRASGDDADHRGSAASLRRLSRSLDAAGEQLRGAAAPMQRSPLGRHDVERYVQLFTEAAFYARSASDQLADATALSEDVRCALRDALEAQRTAVGALADGRCLGPGELRSTEDRLGGVAHGEPGSVALVAATVSRLGATLTELVTQLLPDPGPPASTAPPTAN